MSITFKNAIKEVSAANNTIAQVISAQNEGGVLAVTSMKPMAYFVKLLAETGYDAVFTQGPTFDLGDDEGPNYSFTIQVRGMMNRIR